LQKKRSDDSFAMVKNFQLKIDDMNQHIIAVKD